MSASDRAELLNRWIKPSSENEQQQQARAEDMVRKAITTCGDFDGSNVLVYTKGSYPNNTNVRRDSDVDVAVELQDCLYYDYKPGITGIEPPPRPYQGEWTPRTWRNAVVNALVEAFGKESVDTSGKIAINISAVEGSRPSADVVPSFDYRRYDNPERTVSWEGSCVFPTDDGAKVVNWPQQQLDNGRNLNTRTNYRYKKYVRALKNAENFLAAQGTIDELPSYFMECLVFNVDESTLTRGSLDEGFEATLLELFLLLEEEENERLMVEPSRMTWLFTHDKKWSVEDGMALVLATWRHFGYGS
ncbi:nucleotidyltransferase [Rhodococcus sp. ACS1]|uniref:nucleotidyltransferase domain-containing protein n=1 Tax=Rhodococcus sp. ACS1 TaxID=2028570 RepID=UPI000BB139F1|nr:nucleotidyltransferase [Rhodococcus sp. ACS1]PBC35523.1 nucleotidyltransferase [Rhodococcus sp. ACS1]